MPHADTTWLGIFALRRGSGAVWGRFDHGHAGIGAAEWTIIIGASLLVVLVMLVSRWRAKRQKVQFLHNSSARMFTEFATAHRLDRANRRLLKRLAALNGVDNASLLFIEPEHFKTAKLLPDLKDSATEARKLRAELFE